MANDWGDVELDAKGVRALAHPVRLAILDRLRRHGPDTATGLAPHVDASPSVTSWHLRHLAEHGLVEDAPSHEGGRKRWWQAVGRGVRFAAGEDPAGYRALSEAMARVEGDLVGTWRRDVEPQLEPAWLAASGRWNTRVSLTPGEVAQIDAAIEAVLTPYVQRETAGDVPPSARPVRLLRFTMPEAESP